MDYTNKSLQKTFEIVEALSDLPLTPTELSDHLQMNRSTLHRFLQNLSELGYVEKLADNKMRLTHQFIRLGLQAQSHFNYLSIAKPFMNKLAERIGESVLLASFNGFKVTYLDKAESSQTVRIVIGAGSKSPPYTVASGKLFLSEMSEEQLDLYLSQTTLKPFTNNTITEHAELKKELLNVKKQQFAIDNEEYELGLKGFACPIRDLTGNIVVVLCIAGFSLRFDEKKTEETRILLQQYAKEISVELGYQGYHTTI